MSIPLAPLEPAANKTADNRPADKDKKPEPPKKAAPKQAVKPAERLVSLDAYRGFIMLAMASAGFGLAGVAKHFPDDPLWQTLGFQFSHAEWKGGGFWDMIQPSFMFMVGVSMAYSYASRQVRGQSYPRMLAHAVFRSFVLVALGVFLSSKSSSHTNFIFPNVLCQIGLGYTFLFLLWNRRPVWQLLAAALILAADWGLFFAYPTPPADFDYSTVNLPANWPHLEGRAAHWDKHTNAAAAADRVFLNWFPREEPFTLNDGGYTTLNFVPSLATMIFGLLAGGLMRSERGKAAKLGWLVGAGLFCLGAGYLLDRYDICPIVKRIWTPSWAVYSTGWTLLMLAGFYLVVDVIGLRRAALPLVVVGMNSILMYCMSQLIGSSNGWIAQNLQRHFGDGIFTAYGHLDPLYSPILRASLVLFVMWLVCVWLYRQKTFVRI